MNTTDLPIAPLAKRAAADAALERASIDAFDASLELRRLLAEIAAALDPFPNFMGLSSVQAVEVEPPSGANPQNGCVVVCPDGELRELVLRMIPAPFDMGGVEQTDEMAELDLPPAEFVAYAHAAVLELLKLLETQQAAH